MQIKVDKSIIHNINWDPDEVDPLGENLPYFNPEEPFKPEPKVDLLEPEKQEDLSLAPETNEAEVTYFPGPNVEMNEPQPKARQTVPEKQEDSPPAPEANNTEVPYFLGPNVEMNEPQPKARQTVPEKQEDSPPAPEANNTEVPYFLGPNVEMNEPQPKARQTVPEKQEDSPPAPEANNTEVPYFLGPNVEMNEPQPKARQTVPEKQEDSPPAPEANNTEVPYFLGPNVEMNEPQPKARQTVPERQENLPPARETNNTKASYFPGLNTEVYKSEPRKEKPPPPNNNKARVYKFTLNDSANQVENTKEEEEEVDLEEPVVVQPKVYTGKKLAKARKKLKMSVRDVADYFKLTTETIEALERDDYNALHCQAYATGYVRAYAALVKLDPDKLIEENPELGSVDVSRLNDYDLGQVPVAKINRPIRIKPAIYRILFLLIIGFALTFGWQERDSLSQIVSSILNPSSAKLEPASEKQKNSESNIKIPDGFKIS